MKNRKIKKYCYRVCGEVLYQGERTSYTHDVTTRRKIKYCMRYVDAFLKEFYDTEQLSMITVNQCAALKGMEVMIK